jgi:hypothetical protein
MPHNEPMQCSIAKLRWIPVALAGILPVGAWVLNSGVGLPGVSAAQATQYNPNSAYSSPSGRVPSAVDDNPVHEQNALRQRQLEQDTDKLLALAQQLKEQVDKSNGNTLSLDAVKKATEIEKLAKRVKNRMRY